MKKILIVVMLLSALFSFNSFASMNNDTFKEIELSTPENEKKTGDPAQDYRWSWLDDNLCVRFKSPSNLKRESIKKDWDIGFISLWSDGDHPKTRDTYAGKWTQAENGIWSFQFDDCTIPVGVTKIDGTLYAFNGYGELQDGYEYYTGLKTGPDGLVTADSAEFQAWLAAQYVPECTSHE